ncbi:MAG: single-stranded-DNA-specific exonuclease RecJ [Clostridia bacterium]|nr:single-stranded-DNA-specific exonuclease RecJ [Clostridia bacterium]
MLNYFKKNWTATSTSSGMLSDERVELLSRELGLSPISCQLLINRGYDTTEGAKEFLMKSSELLHDPFLLKDIDRASDRIIAALEGGERIVIYGDYDVDGVTSVSILYLYLKSRGANISYYIPTRLGLGYGMSTGAIDKIAASGVDLIVTVDTGITAVEEARYIKSLGVSLVITDHHECHGEIPDAEAVINPRQPDCEYPFKELAGVGVAFKLLCAMEKKLNPDDPLSDCVARVSADYADLVAIGTVADVMPVKDENRLLVSYGLKLMEEDPRIAVSELLSAVNGDSSKYKQKKRITSGVIGFTIAPRINAAGRIKDASIAVELFLAEDREKAAEYANLLCEINRERQAEENKIIESANAKIEAEHDFANDPVIVLSDRSWHHGVIGIVASRITEKYKCPSVLVSFEDEDNTGSDDDVGKGSGRSVKGLNLVEALTYCSDLLVKYGGHELTAGLTVTRGNLPEFRRRINEYARERLGGDTAEGSLVADIELSVSDVDMKSAKELYLFEPFGVSNPVPLFMMRNMTITAASDVGGGKHARLILSDGNYSFQAMYFRRSVADLDVFVGDTVDVMFNLDVNNFQGRENIQFILKDITLSASQLEDELRDRETSSAILSGTYDFSSATSQDVIDIVPTRDDFRIVYNTLRRELRMEHNVFSIRALRKLLEECGYDFKYIKLKLIIKIFQELNLLSVDETDADREIYNFKYVFVKNKTDLDKSNLYRKIKTNFSQKNNR